MRIDRRILYFTAITLTTLTFTLTVTMVISTYRNLHREREKMEESLIREGIALLRLFEAIACDSDLAAEGPHVQQSAAAVPNDDVAYIYLLNQHGAILAHSDPQRIGQQIDGDLPGREGILKLRRDNATDRILEIRRYCQSTMAIASETTGGHYFGIGLKMTEVERIYHEDHKHRMMMTGILILLGTATLFFTLVVQNSYLVQRTLDRMKSYIHYVVESMANGIISLDADGMVTTINPTAAELIGISKARAQGLSFDSLFPEHIDEIKSVLWNDSTVLDKEIEYKRPDGSLIPVSLSATQVKDNNGTRLGAVILLHDLREVKELHERAQRAEHLASIGRMAATVAHEIRNPLSSIRGFAQYFVASTRGKEEEQTYALTMIEESDRLNLVVSELLDYARPLELNLEKISIRTLFEDTVRMIALETGKKNVKIKQEMDLHIPLVELDRDRLLQVLLNLAQNSIAAMPDGGELILQATWSAERQNVQITVRDTGAGIPEQDMPRLFDPFFTTKTHGTGLGLAIVHKIVDAHGGKIEVQSKRDKGTTVVLALPQPLNTRKREKVESNGLKAGARR
jgi:two-component system sensor histidine kinase HydH